MSVRAYRLIEIKAEREPTFNLWHNNDIVEWLNLYDGMTDNGDGLVGCTVDSIEEMLDDTERGFDIAPEIEKALREDVKKTKAEGGSYVEWLCY